MVVFEGILSVLPCKYSVSDIRADGKEVFFIGWYSYFSSKCVTLPYVYLLYYVCIAVLTLDAGLLARSQYPEGPATGHLDTGFSWFPCV